MPPPLGAGVLVGFLGSFCLFLGEIWAGFHHNTRLLLLFIPAFIAPLGPPMQTGPSPRKPGFAGGALRPRHRLLLLPPMQTPNLEPGGGLQ